MDILQADNFEDVHTLADIWREAEQYTRDVFGDQSEETLAHVKSVRWGDRTVSFTVAKVFIHLATHETHHRGLIAGLLRQLGYEPPDVNML